MDSLSEQNKTDKAINFVAPKYSQMFKRIKEFIWCFVLLKYLSKKFALNGGKKKKVKMFRLKYLHISV